MRIKDTDGDGHADLYENATDDFGISGIYHEFNYGPVKDKAGNLFIALNTASSGGGVRPVVRGKLNIHGRDGINGHSEMFSVGTLPRMGDGTSTPDGKLHPLLEEFVHPTVWALI